MKRFVDLAIAILLFPIGFLVVTVAMIMIKMESPGPAIFRQQRLGRNKRPFCCYKLRTMKQGTRNAASHEVGTTNITRVGHFLRASKIDELPQLVNVIRGEMSLVGPRPGLPEQGELTKVRDTLGIFETVPGITGLAQVQGIEMSDPIRLARVDQEYILNRSLMMDFRLLFQTVLGSGRGDAAQRSEGEK